MTQYSANARNWFGPGWTSYIQIAPPAGNTGPERSFPNGQYGQLVPQVWGKARVLSGNVIWFGEITDSSDPATASTTANAQTSTMGTFAVGICRGPIHALLSIWADDVLIYTSAVAPNSELYGGVTVYLGDEAQTADPVMEGFEGSGNVPAYRGLAYIVCENLPLKDFGNKIPAFSFEVQAQTAATVDLILSDLAQQVGLSNDDIDFACVDSPVTGMIVTNRQAAREVMQPLLDIFQADIVEFDGKLQAIPRGGSSLATLTDDDVGAKVWNGSDSAPTEAIQIKRMSELDLPRELDLNFYSADKGYDSMTALALRYDKPDNNNPVSINTNLVLTEDDARAIAERMLYQQWIERESYTVNLMPAFMRFTPGAVLTLPVNDELIRVRVVQMDLGLWGPVGITAVRDDTGHLIQSVPGAVVETSAPAQSGVVATAFRVFDNMAVRDEDSLAPGFYIAATGISGWRGAKVYYSVDGGANYIYAQDVTARAVFGQMTEALMDGTTAGFYDDTQTATLALDNPGALAFHTLDEITTGGYNQAVIGEEILAYERAAITDAPTRAYQLQGFLRGLRETPMTGHTNTDLFAVITPALTYIPVSPALIGFTLYVKAVSPGQTLADVTGKPVVIGANHPTGTTGGGLTTGTIAAIEASVAAANPGYLPLLNASGTEFVYAPNGDFILVPV